MNILIIYSHPYKNAYTFQVLEHLKKILTAQNCNIEISDLYAMNFQTDMTEQEYEREAFGKTELPVSNDVLGEHKKIEAADCIIFIYPVWWSDCPAKMKGWFDRVFSVGYAYKHKPGLPKMKTIQYGVAICTAGYTNEFLNEKGIAQSMQTIMLADRFGQRFAQKEMLILGGTLNVENVRQQHIKQLEELVIKIKNYCG